MYLFCLSFVVYSFQRKSNREVTLLWLNGFHDLNNLLLSLWKWPSPGKSTVLCGKWVILGGEWEKEEEIASCKINNFHVSSQAMLKSCPLSERLFSIICSAGRATQVISWAVLLSPERDPHIFDQLIFIKMLKLFNGKRKVFLAYGAETTRYL